MGHFPLMSLKTSFLRTLFIGIYTEGKTINVVILNDSFITI